MRILVLPGIGDIYWTMVALPALLERWGETEPPEVWVWDFDGRRRSLEYVERVPFVRAGGYWRHDNKPLEFRRSYMEDGESVFPDFRGFDVYLAANGALRWGRTVEEAFDVPCDWRFPLRTTEAEAKWADTYRQTYGRYVVAHFSDFGMFGKWVRAWGVHGCVQLVREVQDRTGLPVLLTGSHWDTALSAKVAEHTGAVDLSGKTDADQFYALFRNAAGCIGWCGGNTILATAFGVPTVMGWSKYFPDARFFTNACPPESLGNWYLPFTVETDTPRGAAELFVDLLHG